MSRRCYYEQGYTGTEKSELILPKYWPGEVRRPVVFCRGSGGNALTWRVWDRELGRLADRGFAVVSTDMGGADTWGNATAITRVGQSWTKVKTDARTTGNVATDKMLLIGTSHGGMNALEYARANPANVAAVVTIVSVIDAQDIQTNNRAGLAAAINTAHGGNVPDARNPADNAAAYAALNIPTRQYYATDDAVCLPAIAEAFATAAGTELVSLGAVGHSGYPAVLDAGDIADFLAEYAA